MVSARHWQPVLPSVLTPMPEPAIARADIEFVDIPAGTFMMGSPETEKGHFNDEGPVHTVRVPAFRMSRYQITNAQYHQSVPPDQAHRPVTNVSWHEAKAFCERIGCRLPTEAEWEYACRAGTTTRYYTGDEEKDLDWAGWYENNSGDRIHPVGQKEPNAFGLFDMHGNVCEWCEDDWHENYKGAPTDGSAWTDNPRGVIQVLRGGSWYSDARLCRSAYRLWLAPVFRFVNLGFRVVLLSSSPRTS
jgi:formylglycine-generating enzyme required for sulfatase activity